MPSALFSGVCVVIPVYKPDLTPYERIALTQCMRVLGRYPIWLAKPHSLDVSVLTTAFPTLRVQAFDDAFFTDIQAYNRLMLSTGFYEAFGQFEYMLIHQLDAFVFVDDLSDWCRRGYDYIGAPWLRDRDFYNWRDELDFTIRKRIAIWFDLKKADGVTPREITRLNGVGNGGLSLRRIPALVRALRRGRQKLNTYQQNSLYWYNEDVFFGVEANRRWPLLRIPDFRTAMTFAIEFYPERAISVYNRGELPFGCHAWDIHGTDYWRPVFARFGYDI